MSAAAVLLIYAVIAGTVGGRVLKRCRWTYAAPVLGVLAWQVLSLSVLGSLLLSGVSVLVPTKAVSTGLADLLEACVLAIQVQYATPGGALLHASALTGTLLLVSRLIYTYVAGMRGARHQRSRQLAGLRLAAHRYEGLDALVLEHPAAAAYCLPGKSGTVVLTSAALGALSKAELAAVMAHERAHLRGRHHLILGSALALARALPLLPVFRWGQVEQAKLVEMIADDQAAKSGSRRDVAGALVRLAGGTASPPAALAAAEVAALLRIERLLTPVSCVSRLVRVGVALSILAAALLPLTIALTPAVAAAQLDYCPISMTSSPS